MRKIIKQFLFVIMSIRFIPHLACYFLHPGSALLKAERNMWIRTIKKENTYSIKKLLWLLIYLPEYRTVFYLRTGLAGRVLRLLAKGATASFINTNSYNIGSGLVLQHGYSTIVEAVTIGNECQIWHNVTIGTKFPGTNTKPIIGNNVKIFTGAIVTGAITIGNNVIIGAGSVVTKSVPDNCTVAGNPACIIRGAGSID